MNGDSLNQVYVGLGSNLGERAENLKNAIRMLNLNPQINMVDQSSVYENEAIEQAGPDEFLNQVVLFETFLSPHDFYKEMQKVEAELDPQRENRGRKKSRYIDLDILTYNNDKINDDVLEIPHPRMQERDFVMNPLNELMTRLYKQNIANDNLEDPAINKLAQYSDFTRSLSEKEKLIIEKIKAKAKSKTDFYFRPLLLEDLDEVLRIDEEAFGAKHWGRDVFVQELNNQHAHYIVVTNKAKKPIAFIGLWFVIDEMHIMTLAVEKAVRRQGLAEMLLLLAFEHAYEHRIRSATLEVKASNTAAIKLYEKYNFKQQGMRPKYYPDGEAALLLWTEEIYKDDFLDTVIASLAKQSHS